MDDLTYKKLRLNDDLRKFVKFKVDEVRNKIFRESSQVNESLVASNQTLKLLNKYKESLENKMNAEIDEASIKLIKQLYKKELEYLKDTFDKDYNYEVDYLGYRSNKLAYKSYEELEKDFILKAYKVVLTKFKTNLDWEYSSLQSQLNNKHYVSMCKNTEEISNEIINKLNQKEVEFSTLAELENYIDRYTRRWIKIYERD